MADFVRQDARKLLRRFGLLDQAIEEQYLPPWQCYRIDHVHVRNPGSDLLSCRIDFPQQFGEGGVTLGRMAYPTAEIADHRLADVALPAGRNARAEPVWCSHEQSHGGHAHDSENRGGFAKTKLVYPRPVFALPRKLRGEAWR